MLYKIGLHFDCSTYACGTEINEEEPYGVCLFRPADAYLGAGKLA
jgi:hypothetical protein